MTEIQYEVREQDLFAFNEHLLQESKPMQKAMRRHQVTIPGLLSIAVLVLWFYYQESSTAIIFMALAVAWAALAPRYFRWSTRRQLNRLYTEEEKVSVMGRYTLRIEPSHLVEVGPNGNAPT
ncbi:hypothetical protein [Methylogaea oryzae]|uniref:hypothetical protein n=1 Tax=Methylogaea oryzae TaxID=1295382 RepID=UPI0006CF88A6|nr:hypothetical protein [Methylogaea oryzae]